MPALLCSPRHFWGLFPRVVGKQVFQQVHLQPASLLPPPKNKWPALGGTIAGGCSSSGVCTHRGFIPPMVPPPCPGAAGHAGLGAHPAAGAPCADQHPQSLRWLRAPRSCLPGSGSCPFPRDGASPLRLSHAVGAAAQPPLQHRSSGRTGPMCQRTLSSAGQGCRQACTPGTPGKPSETGLWARHSHGTPSRS